MSISVSTMVPLTVIFFISILVLFAVRNFIRTLINQICLDIPSFESLPVIGHFHRFYNLSAEEAFCATNEFSDKFPSMSKLWQFHHLTICINSPELAEKVLISKSCMQRPLFLLKFFEVDEGLLSSRYDQWTHDRRFMIQFFNPRKIKTYTKSFFESAERLVEGLRTHELMRNFDILPYLERSAVQGVCVTLFGMHLDDTRIDEIYRNTSTIFQENTKTFEAGLKNPLRFLDFVRKATVSYKNVKRAQNNLINLLTNSQFEEQESLLEILLKENSKMFNEKQIREHLLTFLNAGLDTTSAHLHFTILFLAMHQHIQEKLARELDDCSDIDDFESIFKLDYLDRVVKESFRLAPPIFLVGRETTENFEIETGLVIPKGTSIAINTFVLHRRADLFGKESKNFDPDNFLPEKTSMRHPFSFQPFSSGRRNCIGYTFATVFVKIVLFKLLRNFTFSTDSKFGELSFKYGMTLKLTKNHNVSIERRNV